MCVRWLNEAKNTEQKSEIIQMKLPEKKYIFLANQKSKKILFKYQVTKCKEGEFIGIRNVPFGAINISINSKKNSINKP